MCGKYAGEGSIRSGKRERVKCELPGAEVRGAHPRKHAGDDGGFVEGGDLRDVQRSGPIFVRLRQSCATLTTPCDGVAPYRRQGVIYGIHERGEVFVRRSWGRV